MSLHHAYCCCNCPQRLQRELRSLNTKTQLPIHSAAAIFVRHDSDRIDKMRVIITGAHSEPSKANGASARGHRRRAARHSVLITHAAMLVMIPGRRCMRVSSTGRAADTSRVHNSLCLGVLVRTYAAEFIPVSTQGRRAPRTRPAATCSTCSSRSSTLGCRR